MLVLNAIIRKQGTEIYEGFSKTIESKFDYTLVECVTEENKSNFFLMIISQPKDRNYRGTPISLAYERIRDKVLELGLLKDIHLDKVKWFDHYERKRNDPTHPKQDITPVSFNAGGNAGFEKVMYTKEFREQYNFDIEESLFRF